MLPWGLRSPLTSALAGRGAIQILVTKQLMNLESVQLNSTSVITCNHLVTLLYRGRRGETDPVYIRNFWFYDTINVLFYLQSTESHSFGLYNFEINTFGRGAFPN